MEVRGLHPADVVELVKAGGGNLLIGAFAALASYALFHLITVFPLSWITLQSEQPVEDVLMIQIIGAFVAIPSIVASGLIADKIGRRRTLGTLAVLIGVFALCAPLLLKGGARAQDVFILAGFVLLGLSYGQAAGAVTSNFEPRFRYTGAALTSDLAWLIGAAFAPLVALGLSARFGLAAVSVYLLSGVVATLVALYINHRLDDER
jgi:MFS family permease